MEPRLYGFLACRLPDAPRPGRRLPGRPGCGRRGGARERLRLRPGAPYLLGPGGTMAERARQLGLATTPLGVDVVQDGGLVPACPEGSSSP